MLISKFHSRSFIVLDYKDSPHWKRQLRKWRYLDIGVTICLCLYIVFCVHFVMLYFASVMADDQIDWVISGAVGFFEDVLIIPAASAIMFPLIAMITLGCSCLLLRASKDVILMVREIKEEITGIEETTSRENKEEITDIEETTSI